MCGRAVQAKGVIPLAVFSGVDMPDGRVANVPPRYNAAPSQELWVIRQNRDTGERSLDLLTVLTTGANELVARIHDRMPLILRREDFDRWLGIEPDPSDLLRPFPADAMTMWPISTRVNSPRNDDADLLTPMPQESSVSPNGGPNSL